MINITIYTPGDGTAGSNSATYNDCKEIEELRSPNGFLEGVRFNTVKHGRITFYGQWRKKEGTAEQLKGVTKEDEAPVRAGNMARNRY